MAVFSIQSSVSFGYVGNSIAIPTLQKLGHDCWYVHTVYFSNHPGHKEFSGEFAKPKTILEKIQKISFRGADGDGMEGHGAWLLVALEADVRWL